MEGDQVWVLQGVLSPRRPPLSFQKTFTVPSLHISNIYAGIWKKLIFATRAVILDEHLDLVAGDFNGAVWWCNKGNNMLVPLKKLLLTALCQRSLAPHPCEDQVRFQAAGLMCAGFSSRPNPIGIGKFDSTMPFPFLMKLQACARPIKAATTKHGFTSTSSNGKTFSHNVKSTIEGSS